MRAWKQLYEKAYSDNRTPYGVEFPTWIQEYRDQVLSLEGVIYIKDTISYVRDPEGYPAIIIATTPETADEIKEFDFVIDIKPAVLATSMPTTPSTMDVIIITIQRLAIYVVPAVILAMLIALPLYFRKRRMKRT